MYLNSQEVIDTLRMELDFENEGKNGEQCAKDLERFKYAYIPKIYWDLSSKVVLSFSLINKYVCGWNSQSTIIYNSIGGIIFSSELHLLT